jgi:hypothetical protein
MRRALAQSITAAPPHARTSSLRPEAPAATGAAPAEQSPDGSVGKEVRGSTSTGPCSSPPATGSSTAGCEAKQQAATDDLAAIAALQCQGGSRDDANVIGEQPCPGQDVIVQAEDTRRTTRQPDRYMSMEWLATEPDEVLSARYAGRESLSHPVSLFVRSPTTLQLPPGSSGCVRGQGQEEGPVRRQQDPAREAAGLGTTTLEPVPGFPLVRRQLSRVRVRR